MAPTISLTRQDLEVQRQEVLRALGVSIEDFTDTVRTNTLSGAEWEAMDRLEEIYFLLDERAPWSVG